MSCRKTKRVINDMSALIYPQYFTEKSQSKLPFHLFKKEDGGL